MQSLINSYHAWAYHPPPNAQAVFDLTLKRTASAFHIAIGDVTFSLQISSMAMIPATAIAMTLGCH
jgi:hypothetical protein